MCRPGLRGLGEIEDRLATLDRLKRKYGTTLAEVMAFGAESARQLGEVENRDALIAELRARQAESAQRYETAAAHLTARRAEAAKRLERLAEKQINELAMQVKFSVGVAGHGDWRSDGWDVVHFLIATNAGEPLKPLDEIASGGEMSRVMLALKVTVEESGGKKKAALPRTLVFDEIDIGIGGRAGGGGRAETEEAFANPTSSLYYPFTADCGVW